MSLTPSRPTFTEQFGRPNAEVPVPPPPFRAPAEVEFLDTLTSKRLKSDMPSTVAAGCEVLEKLRQIPPETHGLFVVFSMT